MVAGNDDMGRPREHRATRSPLRMMSVTANQPLETALAVLMRKWKYDFIC